MMRSPFRDPLIVSVSSTHELVLSGCHDYYMERNTAIARAMLDTPFYHSFRSVTQACPIVARLDSSSPPTLQIVYSVTPPCPSSFPGKFPPEILLLVIQNLALSDLLSLRLVGWQFNHLATPFSHTALILRLPYSCSVSIDHPDIVAYVIASEMSLACFVSRYGLQHIVKKVIFRCWVFGDRPLWFRNLLLTLDTVVYEGTSSYELDIPVAHILPSCVKELHLSHVRLSQPLHCLLGPHPILTRLGAFAVRAIDMAPLSQPPQTLELDHWYLLYGLIPYGLSYSEAAHWYLDDKSTLQDVSLNFTWKSSSGMIQHIGSLLDAFLAGARFVPYESILPSGMSFPHRLSLTKLVKLALVLYTFQLGFLPIILDPCSHVLRHLHVELKMHSRVAVFPVHFFPDLCRLRTLVLHCEPVDMFDCVSVLATGSKEIWSISLVLNLSLTSGNHIPAIVLSLLMALYPLSIGTVLERRVFRAGRH
ncbi:hypothetical protein BDZ89DRAFT_1138720 [Hymenopellis radicata]|nr:hypothetical protein BDZ89DRAFT_1138720 [Hymenopellis radicata]